MTQRVASGDGAYRLLGAFRFLLASLVMVQHANALLPAWLDDALVPLEIGNMAVFCFFTVSGFVIAEAASTFYVTRPVAFMLNRLLRLYPTYLVALVISAIVLSVTSAMFVPTVNESPVTPERFALPTVALNALALLPFWRQIQSQWNVPEILEIGWALRIEFLFYLALAGCLFIGSRLRLPLPAILSTAAVLVLGTIALAPAGLAATSLENAPYFILGVAYFHVVTGRAERWFPAAFCLASLAFIAAHLLGRAPVFGVADFPRDRAGELVLLLGLTAMFGILARTELGHDSRLARLAGVDRFLGELTYPLYLVHWCVLVAVRSWLPHPSWLSVAVAFATAYVLSFVVVLAIEQPVARLRARVRRRKARSIDSPAIQADAVLS